jgi:hypothetical protein
MDCIEIIGEPIAVVATVSLNHGLMPEGWGPAEAAAWEAAP